MKKRIIYLIGLIFLNLYFIACVASDVSVDGALSKSFNNRKELEKVIDHYKENGEKEKLKAVYFLLKNMPDKIGYDGPEVRKYDGIFYVFDSLIKKKALITVNSPFVLSKWDSITKIQGKPSLYEDVEVADIETINSDFLIKDVDLAFELWRTSPDYKYISFDSFCEWLLPYRIGTEAIEPWRKLLYNQFATFRDTANYRNSYV
ncbi:MAG TPA: hypothetical protein VF273_05245 [Pelobium sp.]